MISLFYTVYFLMFQADSEASGPPPPSARDTRGVEAPIDDNIWILLVMGLLLGAYVIYKRYQSINKVS